MLEWLLPSGSNTCSHEVLWEAGALTHQEHHSTGPGTTPAYQANCSTEDAVNTALHSALSHLEKSNCWVRMLFVDFSSAFNTVVPHKLVNKLKTLSFSSHLCSWIMDFLSHSPQRVRIRNNISSTQCWGCYFGSVACKTTAKRIALATICTYYTHLTQR